MSTFSDSIYKLKVIDDVSNGNTIIHRINPLAKLIVTLIYIITIVSFENINITGLLPFILYIIVIIYITDISIKFIFKISLIGLPFILGIGVFNLIFERTVVMYLGYIPITLGLISFITLLVKGLLTITSGILLVCTTGIENIAKSLRILRVPKIFTSQLVFMYRYIFVLIESAGQIYNAYMLRAPKQKGIHFKVWGSLLGQLLIRSFERADRIYNAMVLRGFKGEYVTFTNEKPVLNDYIYILFWISFFISGRLVNIPMFIGNLVMGSL